MVLFLRNFQIKWYKLCRIIIMFSSASRFTVLDTEYPLSIKVITRLLLSKLNLGILNIPLKSSNAVHRVHAEILCASQK